jgi:neutral ceramidase
MGSAKKLSLLVALGLALGLAWWALSDRCGERALEPPQPLRVSAGAGILNAGAARVDFEIPFPVVVAGKSGWRPEASVASTPLAARALVLENEGTRVGFVALELLLVTDELQQAIQSEFDFSVIVTATHTHSSLGHYDERWVSQAAALGAFRADCFNAISTAARAALTQARAQLMPVQTKTKQATHALCRARSGTQCDTSMSSLELVRLDGSRAAQVVLASIHPTQEQTLHGDWPGELARLDEARHSGVTLVWQGAVGNSSYAHDINSSTALAEQLLAALDSATDIPSADTSLALSVVSFSVPHPDGTRLAPWPFSAMAENALCQHLPQRSSLALVRLGGQDWVFLPVEVTFSAAPSFEAHAVSLAMGYAGYVESLEEVQARGGESKKQYFGPEFLQALTQAAALAKKLTPPLR